MSNSSALRKVLLASGIFTLSGCLLFGFPALAPGRFAGLPPDVVPVYRVLAALMMLMFGMGYLWLAAQQRIPHAGVVAGILAKVAACGALLALWVAGALDGRTMLACSGDIILAVAMWACIGGAQRSNGEIA